MLFQAIFLLSSATLTGMASPAMASCDPQSAAELTLNSGDFHWGYTMDEMAKRFDEIYASGKRLPNRAYKDPKSGNIIMNLEVSEESGAHKPVILPPMFIQSITRHVEISLERRYADFVFFPDLGHAHFFYPIALKDRLTGFPVEQYDRLYQGLVNEPSLKILYHTAEQLQMTTEQGQGNRLINDPGLRWRYYSRNVIGDNHGGEDTATYFAFGATFNTLHDLAGYGYWSAGFNISASKDGCFPYRKDGKTYYFDLSWNDLPPPPNEGGGD